MKPANDDDRFEIGPNSGAGPRTPILRRFALLVLIGACTVLTATTVLFVDETELVIVERFGNIVAVYDRPEDRGIHFKLPWPIDATRRFDRRVHLFDPPGREIFTNDRKNITVDAYICWRIAPAQSHAGTTLQNRPVVRYFRGLGQADVAESRLDSRLRSILSRQIGQVELSALLNVDDSEQGPESQQTGLLEELSEAVHNQVIRQPGEPTSLQDRLGIEIVDVRIKRINLPLGNQQAVFERMKSERKKIADRYRSAGMAENTVIRSQADRQYNALLAKAQADAERIRGEADAEAIRILNRAHAQDPDFYRVIRTLDTYRKILNERTTLVLSASSNLLKMLTEGVPDMDTPPPAAPASPSGTESQRGDGDVSQLPPAPMRADVDAPAKKKQVVTTSDAVNDGRTGGGR